MINKIVLLHEIRYDSKEPSQSLLESVRVRGIVIPIRVNTCDTGYECIDGHKRLTACAILSKEDSKYSRIPVMIVNDYSKSGSSYWGNTQNHH